MNIKKIASKIPANYGPRLSGLNKLVMAMLIGTCFSVATATYAGSQGNSQNAQLCHNKWQSLRSSSGMPFKNQGACVSYAAKGGQFQACIDSEAALRAAAVAGGVYNLCTQMRVVLTAGEVPVGTNLSLSGVGGGNAVIDANGASRVFNVSAAGQLTLKDVTVTGGFVNGDLGGGIIIDGGSVTLNGNSAVVGNSASSAGGVMISPLQNGGSLILNDSATVSNNSASFLGANYASQGGGVWVNAGGTLIMNASSSVRNNTVQGPYANNGGGLIINVGTVQMNDSSSISGNTCPGCIGGGVFFVNGGLLALSGSASITGNTASDGGGIYRFTRSGTFTGITSSNVTNNTPNNCSYSGTSPDIPGCVN